MSELTRKHSYIPSGLDTAFICASIIRSITFVKPNKCEESNSVDGSITASSDCRGISFQRSEGGNKSKNSSVCEANVVVL